MVGGAAHLPGRRCAVLILLSSSEEHTECRRALTEKTGQVVAVGSDLGAGSPYRRNLRRGPMGSGVQPPHLPLQPHSPSAPRALAVQTPAAPWSTAAPPTRVPGV